MFSISMHVPISVAARPET